ncbi:MAG: Hsp20/alpha crystallin family protein [Patescibacteria group bacterium]|nr:Hsp20/alpha crystallin family protein [Patescibacteria group bacterium]
MLKNIFFAKNLEADANRITFGETTDEVLDKVGAELPIDLVRTGNKIIVRTPIVGANADDISITIENNTLTITKNSFREESDEEEYFYLQECHWGPLSRVIELPKEVDPERIRATLDDGILTVILPLANKAYTKVINVRDISNES